MSGHRGRTLSFPILRSNDHLLPVTLPNFGVEIFRGKNGGRSQKGSVGPLETDDSVSYHLTFLETSGGPSQGRDLWLAHYRRGSGERSRHFTSTIKNGLRQWHSYIMVLRTETMFYSQNFPSTDGQKGEG